MLDTSKWREKKGIIYLTVTSDGTTGKEWIRRLEDKGFHLDYYVESALLSPDFKPTNGLTTEVAVLKGSLFSRKNRITNKIRNDAAQRGLLKPNAEVACLIREMFLVDEEIKAMGLRGIITMHEPINSGYNGMPALLGTWDGEWISTNPGGCDKRWPIENGFAFAISD